VKPVRERDVPIFRRKPGKTRKSGEREKREIRKKRRAGGEQGSSFTRGVLLERKKKKGFLDGKKTDHPAPDTI